jgi:HD-like signal output (HDOD) protein
MGAKTILLAIADPQALAEVSEALGTEWMATAVRNEPEAAAQLKQYSFNAFLVDFNLGSPDASGLLELARAEHPETTRFLLAYEADLALVATKVEGPHHVLAKPIDFAALKNRVEEEVAFEQSNADGAGVSESRPRPTASIPEVYAKVIKALEVPEVTSEQVGEIIASDEALAAEVLGLANSSYLGLPRNLTRPAEAVASLGLDAVKALVMARRHLAEHSHVTPGYLSFGDLWEHSTRVAQVARDLVLFETRDRALAGEAFAAGLVHDFGKVVLVTNFDDLYGRVHSLARNQPVALWDIEREMFGANHGEIGGCLVGMWNLPGSVVEATAFHHDPPVGEQDKLTALAAVHIADVLVHQLWPKDEFRVGPTVNTAFLSGFGLLQRLPVWRAAFANRNARLVQENQETEPQPLVKPPTVVSSAPPLPTGDQSGGQVTATRTATAATSEPDEAVPPRPVTWPIRKSWAYAGVAVLVLVFALWMGARQGLNEPEPVQARMPAAAPTALIPEPVSEAAPTTSKPPGATQVAAYERPSAEAATLSAPAPLSTVPNATPAPVPLEMVRIEPVPAAAPSPTIASPTLIVEAPNKKAGEFRLNGIIYTASNPTAIVNGSTVRVGDKLSGATIVKIGSSEVTLEIEGQQETLRLK